MNYNTRMNTTQDIKQAIARALASVGIEAALADIVLEHPAELSHGDYATSVALKYAKQAARSPRDLAAAIVDTMGTIVGVSKIDIAGPGFINFTLASQAIAGSLDEARSQDMPALRSLGVGGWGANDLQAGKKIMVEYTDPNPFKEFHIGHLMSNATGESISRLLQFSGAEVRRACYQGDVGLHVAKTIHGLRSTGLYKHNLDLIEAGQTGLNVRDLGEAYRIGVEDFEKSEKSRADVLEINKIIYGLRPDDTESQWVSRWYKIGRQISLEHFEEIYKILGTKFDHYFFESNTGTFGKQIVEEHPEVFEKSDGAIVYKGDESKGLHTRVFINSEGLPTYEAKELGLAKVKYDTYPYDTSVVITGNEVNDYFKVLLDAMSKVFPDLAAKTVHISHGMMRFADGKMSSRTGNVITGESLLNELAEAAKARAAESRAEDHDKLAEQIAVAAIKYQILKQGSGKDIVFDRERALSLEGDSGPYLQYAYARTNAVIAKAHEQGIEPLIDKDASPSEVTRLLHRFPEVVAHASHELEPHIVAQYLLHLASAFNSWYAQEQILDGTSAAAHKVAVVEAVNRTLKNGLWILGIPAPEKM